MPFARPKLGVIYTHGGSKCRRPRPWCSKRRNEHIRPVGSLQEERPREMDCNLIEVLVAAYQFLLVRSIRVLAMSHLFLLFRISGFFWGYRRATVWSRVFWIVVCPPWGKISWFGAMLDKQVSTIPSLYIHFSKTFPNGLRSAESWLDQKIHYISGEFDCLVFSLLANTYLRMLQVSERLWLDKNLLNWS